MPEKTKLEDYANMNNTGFAFIDLNEELGDEDLNSEEYSIDEKLYNKFNEIYESGKALFLRIKSKYFGEGIYYELMNYKNATIYKENENLYIHMYFGGKFIPGYESIDYDSYSYTIVIVNILKSPSNEFAIDMYREG